MTREFVSGTTSLKKASDLHVIYSPRDSGGHRIEVFSKVQVLYGKAIEELARQTLDDLGISHAKIEIQDAGALPFVIQARIEAAVKMAHPELDRESLPEVKPHCLGASRRERFRRSRLYVPGNQAKLMINAGIHGADGIILDLEDAVAPVEKASARLIVRNALRVLDFFGSERMVRINQGDLGQEDLKAIIPHNVHLILLPKVESADQVRQVDLAVTDLEREHDCAEPVFFMPILESGRGILAALEIAQASPRNVALAIGLEDYTADLGVPRTLDGKESFFARSFLINAARAAGIQAIDTVFSDVGDMDGLRNSVVEAKQLGFDGKGCIHPRQIRVVHEAFLPTPEEIGKAKKIVVAFDHAQNQGLGVVSMGSKMIDPPIVKRALQTVELAIVSGVLNQNWKEEDR